MIYVWIRSLERNFSLSLKLSNALIFEIHLKKFFEGSLGNPLHPCLGQS